jgi:hypothetical protein
MKRLATFVLREHASSSHHEEMYVNCKKLFNLFEIHLMTYYNTSMTTSWSVSLISELSILFRAIIKKSNLQI